MDLLDVSTTIPGHAKVVTLPAVRIASTEFLLAFAQGLTAMVAIAASVLGFLIGRLAVRRRIADRPYELHLAGIVVTGLYLFGSGILCWWTWCEVAESEAGLLFGWPAATWLWLMFGPLVLLGALASTVGAALLGYRLIRSWRSGWTP
jgi:hypothetical protein